MNRPVICVLLLVLMWSNTAWAFPTFPSKKDSQAITSTSYVITGVVVAGAITSIGGSVGLSISAIQKHNKRKTSEYIQRNAPAVAQDMTLGAGQSLDDLAALAGVEPRHRRAFAKAVHKQRRQLVPLFDTAAAREVCVARLFAIAQKLSS